MSKVIVYPFAKGRKSTRMLREGGCRVRYATSTVRRGVAIAWGNPRVPPWYTHVKWINDPVAIRLVSNKELWAQLELGPESTTLKGEAMMWASEQGEKVMCRTILNGKGGAGIVVARNPSQVVDAPLYTKYFKKMREYRVIYSDLLGFHYAASKRLRSDVDMSRDARLIRTKAMGYTFQTEQMPLPSAVEGAVMLVGGELAPIGLNILGYDVAYNTDTDTACVIEANSAFGLNDYTGPIVADALKELGELM